MGNFALVFVIVLSGTLAALAGGFMVEGALERQEGLSLAFAVLWHLTLISIILLIGTRL